MSVPRVGFYVHYHGRGHKHRTEAILKHLTIPSSVVTSRIDKLPWSGPTLSEVIGIECDNEGLNEEGLDYVADVPSLHFAPLWSHNITDRVAAYTKWLATAKPDLMVVDVSAEISMLTRLASVPQIVMRQHGDRSDPAHINAYAAAHSLLAPFPEMMEDSITPAWIKQKTVYLDGFCRHTNTTSSDTTDKPLSTEREPNNTIAFLFGRGGSGDVHSRLRDAALALPSHQILVVGKEANESNHPSNLHYLGWVDNASAYCQSADVVVTAAGHNSVMELGHSRCKFIAIAEPRPFAEQIRKVQILQREELAVGLEQWPTPHTWPSLVQSALSLDTSKWDHVFRNDGAKQAAKHIEQVALWSHNKRHHSETISI
ncbi:glycosyltransferase [Rhodopirellula sallentina]|uniref:Glycosyl transferase family 28 C-terminal domain-containing protein n=1 Tax=Rhodopirellula sallentina SM41 TaxID=1263870 RepID=M5U624_9BACT|nr:glycosyltransferase [Rhodopirellula sallentina]EMI53306.1 hypothetical protein RSSM_05279 [Rhodopirellula sallentina SM41]